MIIIKIIILYFIEITHTDDFSSTGTRLLGIIVHRPDSFERLHSHRRHLLTFVAHASLRDLCYRGQLKLSACFSSSLPSMIPYRYRNVFILP